MSSFLRYALGFNGVAMVAWSPVLFFYHHMIITSMEGRKVATTKTNFDIMIWRITSLWVAFTGLTCLFLIDMPSGCKKIYIFFCLKSLPGTSGAGTIL